MENHLNQSHFQRWLFLVKNPMKSPWASPRAPSAILGPGPRPGRSEDGLMSFLADIGVVDRTAQRRNAAWTLSSWTLIFWFCVGYFSMEKTWSKMAWNWKDVKIWNEENIVEPIYIYIPVYISRPASKIYVVCFFFFARLQFVFHMCQNTDFLQTGPIRLSFTDSPSSPNQMGDRTEVMRWHSSILMGTWAYLVVHPTY